MTNLMTLSDIEKEQMKESSVTLKDGRTVVVNRAREASKQAIKKNLWENTEIKNFRERFKKQFGFDFANSEKFPVMKEGFTWNKVAQKMGYTDSYLALREADSASNFVQVLRAGIQNIVNSMYETVDVTYTSWCQAVNSSKNTELYAPLHGISFLREVGAQELYGESRAAGLSIQLVNRKYGTMFAVEKELLADDQTGQFQKQAGLLGEYAALAMEVIVMAKLAGVFTGGAVANYQGLIVPNTETKPSNETNYPYTSSSAPFQGGGFNKPASFSILNQAGVIAAVVGLMNQKNLLGLKMSVNANRILVSPQQRFQAALLLNSSFYPSTVNLATTGGANGNVMAINPIQSIGALTVSRFMPKNDATFNGDSYAWYMMDDTKPFFVAQVREAANIEQEAPNAGASFDRDIIRFRLTMRGNADHIDPRFVWQGNDGTVSS